MQSPARGAPCAPAAKHATKTCVAECERLRTKYLPLIRARATELSYQSGNMSAGLELNGPELIHSLRSLALMYVFLILNN